MAIKDTIFEEWFSHLDALTDANKNVDNKGTFQRFVESLAQDLDENIKPLLDDSFTNLVDPRTMLDKYLSLREAELGNDVLFLGSSIANRRKIIEGWHRFVSIKGTKRAYELFFDMLGLTYTVSEIFNTSGFDSGLGFDSSVRPVFDSGRCSPCTFYAIELTGAALTDELLQTIYNIIEFNQPINAILGILRYNGVDLINIIPLASVTGWDTLQDGFVDANAVALALNDPSGTFRSYQFLENSIGDDLASGDVYLTFTAVSRYTADPDINLGTYVAVVGASLSNPAFWTTSFALYNYIGVLDISGNEEQFTFTKLLYANNESKKNGSAVDIVVKISMDVTGVGLSSPRPLELGMAQVEGTYFSPTQIAIAENSTKFYLGELNPDGLSQGFTDRFYTTRNQAITHGLTSIVKLKLDTDNNALGDLYYLYNQDTYYLEATGEDADGFTTYAAPDLIDSTAYISSFRPMGLLDQSENGRRLVMVMGTSGSGINFRLWNWDGVSAWVSTSLSGGAFTTGTSIIGAAAGDLYSEGTDVWIYANLNTAGVFRGVTKMSYTGDPKVVGNWSRADICTNVTSGVFTGTGASADVSGCQSIYVDTDNLVNGEPVIYLTNRNNSIIQRIYASILSPASPADWTVDIAAGQAGVAGNTDGVGGAATFTMPNGIARKGDLLYIAQYVGGNNIRTLNINTLEVTDYKGDYGVAGSTDFEEY